MDDKDPKKQIPLRLTPVLWKELSAWADDEFRSVNGQIEYLLTECVKKRKHNAEAAAGNDDGGKSAAAPHEVFLRQNSYIKNQQDF